LRAWVLSPDGYTILPMRPITTVRTIAIFMIHTARQKKKCRQRKKVTRILENLPPSAFASLSFVTSRTKQFEMTAIGGQFPTRR
jgi:hypothetical protein